jgi:hypothetical protein
MSLPPLGAAAGALLMAEEQPFLLKQPPASSLHRRRAAAAEAAAGESDDAASQKASLSAAPTAVSLADTAVAALEDEAVAELAVRHSGSLVKTGAEAAAQRLADVVQNDQVAAQVGGGGERGGRAGCWQAASGNGWRRVAQLARRPWQLAGLAAALGVPMAGAPMLPMPPLCQCQPYTPAAHASPC